MEDYLILVTYWDGRTTRYDSIVVTATCDTAALGLARNVVKSRRDVLVDAFHLDIAEVGGKTYSGPMRSEECW